MTTAKSSLYRATVPLGLDLAATIEIVEIDPRSAPESGAEWPTDRDWPIAQLRIDLPGGPSYWDGATRGHRPTLAEAVRTIEIKVLDEILRDVWGNHTDTGRRISVTASHEYLDDAVTALRARAESELALVIAHVAKRAARLAQRERTLAAGRAGRPRLTVLPDRVLELDDARQPAAPLPPADDAASQRYALLEINATAEEATPMPVRAPRSSRRRAA